MESRSGFALFTYFILTDVVYKYVLHQSMCPGNDANANQMASATNPISTRNKIPDEHDKRKTEYQI